MVRVGEVGGILPDVTEKLGQFMERTEEIKRFIVSSSIYPSILFLVGIISVIVIMGFVVPRFAGIFNDLGQKIPFSTQILISVSVFLRAWWPVILLAAGLIFFVLWRFSRTPAGKDLLDRIVIKAPVFGSLMTDIQVSRFARTLGTLVTSGVPLTKGLSIVQRVVSNSVVRAAVEHIVSQVREGRRVSALMKEKGIFPAMAVQMVSLGEETGRIGEMLVLVAEELDNKIQSRIKSYLALMEPLAILIMGLIIGGIVVSMLSAIFGINEIEF
jgi:general secretion pathway protein F